MATYSRAIKGYAAYSGKPAALVLHPGIRKGRVAVDSRELPPVAERWRQLEDLRGGRPRLTCASALRRKSARSLPMLPRSPWNRIYCPAHP